MGCGWLGFPLAVSLIEKGYIVKGSTTSAEKKEVLSEARIQPYLIELSSKAIKGDIDGFLSGTDVFIVNIPPKLRGINSENFVLKILLLIENIKNHNVKKVLFISSTSVYTDDNSIVSEATQPRPQTESGKQLLEAEQKLQACPEFETTIIRFGGLIGGERHPIYFLSGKKNIKNPNAPLNLIHRDDCMAIIEKILATEKWGTVFNAVYPDHPSKKEYYSRKAAEFKLTPPNFDEATPSTGKTISSDKLIRELNYRFTTAL
ncbi:NAD(P)H-binding protein [Leptobacterium flavescens]|uniref:NAD(P)H-binding protein n=2 Tax=Leptobacterium flavescens TaxID=472055 RepID=A0A6P0URG9_9FLAO|nr:NAD(P)H-binding protein [Leptobacterium flavescens]